MIRFEVTRLQLHLRRVDIVILAVWDLEGDENTSVENVLDIGTGDGLMWVSTHRWYWRVTRLGSIYGYTWGRLHVSVIWGNTERRIRFDLSIHKRLGEILTTSQVPTLSNMSVADVIWNKLIEHRDRNNQWSRNQALIKTLMWSRNRALANKVWTMCEYL